MSEVFDVTTDHELHTLATHVGRWIRYILRRSSGQP